jgi:2,5-diketo-D-gluconate reductase A
MIDTAAIYRNEVGVGKGIGQQSDIFLQTKIWNESQGFEQTKKAFHKSLERLSVDSVDMLLIHWPCPDNDLFVDTWKAMIELREEKLAHSIGVSNFRPQDLEKLVKETGVTPAVNQIELHPGFQQRELQQVHQEMGIVTQTWSPLGQGKTINHETIRAIAEETGQPAGAVIIRWHIQHGFSTIPKASQRQHMEENFRALWFSLTDEQMTRIDELDDAEGRIGPDPNNFS